MNRQKLQDLALQGVDTLGYQLDRFGITSKVNRHNLAAYLMHGQKQLEGEWDSLQVRFDLQKARFERLSETVEQRANRLLRPLKLNKQKG
jgi:hypothetical protein